MKIALVHNAGPPIVGGVETVLFHQACQIFQHGHKVSIIAGRGHMWNDGIPVIIDNRFDSCHPLVLSMKEQLDKGEVPAEFLKFSTDLLIALHRFLDGVDVAIVHNIASLHKNLALTCALYNYSQSGASPRLILWHHDLAWLMPEYQDELHDGWPWDLLRTPWGGVQQVVVSEARRSELADLMKIKLESISVIPAGMELEAFFGLQPQTCDFVRSLSLNKASPLLLTPVRLTRRKNLELAIKTMSCLRNSLPDAMLVITGPAGAHNPTNSDYFSQLKDLRRSLNLQGTVHLLAEYSPDGLSPSQVAEFYRLADCLFLPSREEGFGIPVLEAGLGRLIIFCTDLPALHALAGESAVYFSPDEDPQLVANKIIFRLSNDREFQLRDHIRKNFSWQGVYENWIKPLIEER
jgi:glycosyltransferase involved in cell wall biosynthesis